MSALQGVIHGKTIELEQEPGLPEGSASPSRSVRWTSPRRGWSGSSWTPWYSLGSS